MKRVAFLIVVFAFLLQACSNSEQKDNQVDYKNYLDFSDSDDQYTGGIKMIPISTSMGEFKVWTKRVGNNPTIKVLLLHGGPGGTHEIFECFDGFLPVEGIEYIYYDQLGSYYSDKGGDSTIWTIEHYVEEVEQVRKALGLNKDNFYLYGLSWGGMLAMEYALKYQDNLKGLIISNMMSSVPEYNKYAQEVLGPQLDPDILAELQAFEAKKDYTNPRYWELMTNYYYTEHLLRKPLDEWPEPVVRSDKHFNNDIYVYIQGWSEFGITGDATTINWDRSGDLHKIKVPTLVIGGTYDTMDPKHMEWMSEEVQDGQFLLCPNGSHLSLYDDQKVYFEGLIKFLKETGSK